MMSAGRNRHSPWVDQFLQKSETFERLSARRVLETMCSPRPPQTPESQRWSDQNLRKMDAPPQRTPSDPARFSAASMEQLSDLQKEILLEHVLEIREEERLKHNSIREWIAKSPDPNLCNGHMQISTNVECPQDLYLDLCSASRPDSPFNHSDSSRPSSMAVNQEGGRNDAPSLFLLREPSPAEFSPEVFSCALTVIEDLQEDTNSALASGNEKLTKRNLWQEVPIMQVGPSHRPKEEIPTDRPFNSRHASRCERISSIPNVQRELDFAEYVNIPKSVFAQPLKVSQVEQFGSDQQQDPIYTPRAHNPCVVPVRRRAECEMTGGAIVLGRLQNSFSGDFTYNCPQNQAVPDELRYSARVSERYLPISCNKLFEPLRPKSFTRMTELSQAIDYVESALLPKSCFELFTLPKGRDGEQGSERAMHSRETVSTQDCLETISPVQDQRFYHFSHQSQRLEAQASNTHSILQREATPTFNDPQKQNMSGAWTWGKNFVQINKQVDIYMASFSSPSGRIKGKLDPPGSISSGQSLPPFVTKIPFDLSDGELPKTPSNSYVISGTAGLCT